MWGEPLGTPVRWHVYPLWATLLPGWEERSQAVGAHTFYPSKQEAGRSGLQRGFWDTQGYKIKQKPVVGRWRVGTLVTASWSHTGAGLPGLLCHSRHPSAELWTSPTPKLLLTPATKKTTKTTNKPLIFSLSPSSCLMHCFLPLNLISFKGNSHLQFYYNFLKKAQKTLGMKTRQDRE